MKSQRARFESWRLPAGEIVESRRSALQGALCAGPMTAGELETVTGIPSRIVGALLKFDMAVGRVKCERGSYALVTAFLEDEQTRIVDAKRLLRAKGYRVLRAEVKA